MSNPRKVRAKRRWLRTVNDLRKFWVSIENLPLIERLLAMPYGLLVILCRYPYKRIPPVLADEFADCCNTDSRLHLNDLVKLCVRDVRNFSVAASSQRFSYRILAAAYLPYLSIFRIVSGLMLVGTMRHNAAEWFERQSEYLKNPRDIKDFALQAKPIVFLGLLAYPLTALLMMLVFNMSNTRKLISGERPDRPDPDCFRILQNVDKQKDEGASAFFFSPIFAYTMLGVFLCGLPAFAMLWTYYHSGLDGPLFHFASKDPNFWWVIYGITMYLCSLSWCLMTVFFGAYFTFPLNFTSTEYEIEIYPDVIKKQPIKGWFVDIALFAEPSWTPKQVRWSDVTEVKFSTGRMPPLPIEATDLAFVRLSKKMARTVESISRKFVQDTDVLRISTKDDSLNVQLWELSNVQRAQLFYCLRKYAPSIHLDSRVQSALVGSAILRDVRYTEIWFDVLANKGKQHSHQPRLPGHSLKDGRFQIIEQLETGGQARVYLCSDESGKKVVLKEFQLTPSASLDVLVESATLFERESTILSQLDHPSIAKMYDMFIDGTRVYLVLEYVNGVSLRHKVRKTGVLDEQTCIKLALQMCDILEYLHGLNPPIVHRDFTPDNLLLSGDGTLKLIDFSAAHQKAQGDEDCVGKHSYTPPEQFRGESCPQSDIYALGATLSFLLTGSDPEPISKCVLPDSHPASIRRIIEACTELELESRFESVKWLRAELERLDTKNIVTEPVAAEVIHIGSSDSFTLVESLFETAGATTATVIQLVPEAISTGPKKRKSRKSRRRD